MSKPAKSLVKRDAPLLLGSESLNRPIDDLSTPDAVALWTLLSTVEGQIKKRKEALRAKLLQDTDARGRNEQSKKILSVPGGDVIKERRVAKTPNADQVADILEEQGLDPLQVFDKTSTYTLNPSKLRKLIEEGKVDGTKIIAATKVWYVLRVHPDKSLLDLLDGYAPGALAEGAEDGEGAP